MPDTEIVRAAARAEWQRAVSVERWKKRTYYGGGLLAAAAAMLLLISPRILESFQPDSPPQIATVPIATVEAVVGEVTVEHEGGADSPTPLTGRATLAAGDIVETTGATGRAVFRLADGASVRFDTHTRVRMHSSRTLTLERGALYVDSDSVGPALTIETAFGSATDIGTRFEVRLAEGEQMTWVRVRDGEVELERDGEQYRAKAGFELAATPDGNVERREIPPCGPLWDLPLEILPELERGSIFDFLEWAGTESCSQLSFLDETAKSLAEADLSASVAGLSLEQALDLVNRGGGDLSVELDRENGILRISSKKPTP